MSVTLSELHTRLSYRLAEDSVPATSGSEWNRRTQFINEGYRSIVRKHYWWWTEATDSFNSVANQTSYTSAHGFPSDIRGSSILELRIDGKLYTPALQSEAFDLQSSNYSGLSQKYIIFNKSLYPLPAYPSSGTDNIVMKYYKIPSALSSGSDTILIPDEYADILVAFALGRKQSQDSKRGSAADSYDEYNEIYKEMVEEQKAYLFALKADTTDYAALYE